MAVKYQVILLGEKYREEELKSILSEYSQITFTEKKDVDKFSPRLYLYMGKELCTDLPIEERQQLIEYANTNIILPVVPNQNVFKENIPQELHAINAHILGIEDEASILTLKNQILAYI